MPRLQVLAVCRDVITSLEENVPSLVAIIDGFIIQVPASQEMDPGIAIAASWVVFVSWKKTEGDDGRHFEQRLRLKLPSGQYVDDVPAQFDFPPPRKVVRITHRTIGFPVQVGNYLVELEIREVGAPEWSWAGDYLIDVGMVQSAAPAE